MGRLIVTELRRLAAWWPVWLLLPAVTAAGRAMLPLNAHAYLKYIYADPQGPDQALEAYRTDVFAVFTSGLGWAQLAAVLAGVALVARADRGQPGAGHPARVLARAAAAAVAGLLLAAVDLAAVLPSAAGHLAVAAPVGADPLGLADPAVWTVLVCGVLQVALFGALGVAVAARVRRRWIPVATALLVAGGAATYLAKDTVALDATPAALPWLAAIALAFPFLIVWYLTITGSAPLALLLSGMATAAAVAAALAKAGPAGRGPTAG